MRRPTRIQRPRLASSASQGSLARSLHSALGESAPPWVVGARDRYRAGVSARLASPRFSSLGSVPAGRYIVVLVAVVLIDVAIQAVNVLNQTRLFAVDPNARSRLNTAFVTSNFIGGAIGSTLAAVLRQRGGWLAVTLGGAVLISGALAIWFTQRRALLGSASCRLSGN